MQSQRMEKHWKIEKCSYGLSIFMHKVTIHAHSGIYEYDVVSEMAAIDESILGRISRVNYNRHNRASNCFTCNFVVGVFA